MYTRALSSVCALLPLLASPAWGQVTGLTDPSQFLGPVTTIDFDGFGHGSAANTLYSHLGVEFRYDAAGSPVPIFDWDALGRQTTSPPNVISTVDGLNGSVFSDTLDLIFDDPNPSEVGAWFGNDQGVLPFAVQLSVFDASDLLLGFTTVQANLNTSVDQFIGIRSDTPIARASFEYLTTVGDLSVTLDDVQFTPVPEPASALLVALGLTSLVARRRRRRSVPGSPA